MGLLSTIRGDYETVYDILKMVDRAGKEGVRKTHIMYDLNLNSEAVSKLLAYLVKHGLITVDMSSKEGKRYKKGLMLIAPKGADWLISMDRIESLTPRMTSNKGKVIRTPKAAAA